MRVLNRFFTRLFNFTAMRRGDERLREEIESHIAIQTDENIRAGMTPEEARHQARLTVGSVEAVRERYHAEESLPVLECLIKDARFSIRQMRRSPSFTLVVVLTLTLGIGATTAVFTLFDQVLLRMLPVEKPRELVRLDWHGTFAGAYSGFGGDTGSYFSYPMYRDLRDRNQVFSGMAATMRTEVAIEWHNEALNENVELVSGNYFEVLGLRPFAGRLFTSRDETQKNANPVAVLSYDEWRTRFGGQPAVIGQVLHINGSPLTIIGVAPESFRTAIGGYRPALFVPLTMCDIAMPWRKPFNGLENHLSLWLTVVARLKPGVTNTQAQASILPLWRGLRAEELAFYKSASEKFKAGYVSKATIKVLDDSRGFSPNRTQLETPLVILLSMAGLLLAMCCLNVAMLLLLRSAARVREMSMRYALGAKARWIVRQLLIEGALLGAAGVAGGLALSPVLAWTLVRLMTNADPGSEPYSGQVDARILLFALAVTFIVTLLFSIVPTAHFLRPDLAYSLRQSTGTASRESQIFRKVAVGVQIALSVLLLGGAGLFLRTLNTLRDQPLGFDATHMATFGLDPDSSGYSEDRTPLIVLNALNALRRVPGVQSVAGTTDPELAGDENWDGFIIQGHKFLDGEPTNFEAPFVSPGYFSTIHQPLLVGRDFSLADAKGAPKVAIVNLAFAKRFYGSAQNALGRLVGETGDRAKADITIVGVVGDVKHENLHTEMGPAVYRPYLQQAHPTGLQIYVRTAQDAEATVAAIRSAIHKMDPILVVDSLRTMEAQVDISASNARSLALLATGFAALAALLAAVGLYGVLAYSTASRTREIGVRLALGAPRWSLVAMVLREMAWIAGTALMIALPSTVGMARLFRSQLYGVSTWDPRALAATVVLTAAVVAIASALPARRATTVDPVEALRAE